MDVKQNSIKVSFADEADTRSHYSNGCFIRYAENLDDALETKTLANQDEFASVVEKAFSDAELISFEPLTGGVSADVYRLDLCISEGNASRVVLRVVGDTYARHSAELEFALLRDLFCSGLPVPEPILVDATCEQLDRPYLIMSFVEGSIGPSETGMEGYIGQMADMLSRVHGTKIGVSSALPKRLDPMEEIFDFLPHGPEWDAARRLLSTLTDTEFNGLPKLLHGDF